MIDLRDASLDQAGARLEVRTMFGGGQVIVPESWNVTSGVMGIGGVGDTRAHVDRGTRMPRTSRSSGHALFGGYAVMSDVPEDELRGLDEQIRRWARHGATAPRATRHGRRTPRHRRPSRGSIRRADVDLTSRVASVRYARDRPARTTRRTGCRTTR